MFDGQCLCCLSGKSFCRPTGKVSPVCRRYKGNASAVALVSSVTFFFVACFAVTKCVLSFGGAYCKRI
ncbi:MAG TPA: hypothetical protein DHU79_06175 [Clostridiales bacterium]|nr:hypothetical protein [Clostridiales bacterium]